MMFRVLCSALAQHQNRERLATGSMLTSNGELIPIGGCSPAFIYSVALMLSAISVIAAIDPLPVFLSEPFRICVCPCNLM